MGIAIIIILQIYNLIKFDMLHAILANLYECTVVNVLSGKRNESMLQYIKAHDTTDKLCICAI